MPVELAGIACRFGRKVVLRSVDLCVERGEIVALLGANGSGKTTLFSLLMGLLQPDSGERRFAGEEADDIGLEIRARMAYVAHAPQLYPLLSGIENLELFARLREGLGGEARAPSEVLSLLGLESAVHERPVSTYSRGMAQRVVLARALAQRPDLYILDEPFTALDREGREVLAQVLRGERERGASVLLSSHDVDVVAAVADRAVLLEDGEIVDEVRRSASENAVFRGAILGLGGRAPDSRAHANSC
jgi:heme ABC exporter ATP-binding subunit CcmA